MTQYKEVTVRVPETDVDMIDDEYIDNPAHPDINNRSDAVTRAVNEYRPQLVAALIQCRTQQLQEEADLVAEQLEALNPDEI